MRLLFIVITLLLASCQSGREATKPLQQKPPTLYGIYAVQGGLLEITTENIIHAWEFSDRNDCFVPASSIVQRNGIIHGSKIHRDLADNAWVAVIAGVPVKWRLSQSRAHFDIYVDGIHSGREFTSASISLTTYPTNKKVRNCNTEVTK